MSKVLDRARWGIHIVISVGLLAAGSIAMWQLVRTRPVPPQRSSLVRVHAVAVEAIAPQTVAAPVVAHGTVRPKHQVKIVPQVGGALTHVCPDLATGRIIPEGTLLFEIDRTLYASRVRQAEAENRRLEAMLDRQAEELAGLDQRLANAIQILAIDERDHLTSKRLLDDEGVGTQREVDALYQKCLAQKDAIAELRSRRDMIPHIQIETQAQLDAAQARLAQVQHDLEHTRIHCPFTARVESVTAYTSQVVMAHFAIATLTDMEAFEIAVGVDPSELRWLDESITPEALEQGDGIDGPPVTVRWSLHGQQFAWTGYVTRFERVDEVTRTARMVVEIRQADMVARLAASPGAPTGPVLSVGMFCETQLPARQLADALVVPRHAIYDGAFVYVFEPEGGDPQAREGRLVQRRVAMLRSIGNDVLVDFAGHHDAPGRTLEPGERVVVSPLRRPVPGMAIRLRDAERTDDVTLTAHTLPRQPVVASTWWSQAALCAMAVGVGG